MSTVVILGYAVFVLTVITAAIVVGLRHAYEHPRPLTREERRRAEFLRQAEAVNKAIGRLAEAFAELREPTLRASQAMVKLGSALAADRERE